MSIQTKELHNWWDGKVIIDEIREYADDRGILVELWRTDDEKMQNDGFGGNTTPQMSYWSITKPMIIRGPHSHVAQTDFFITWKGRMIYQLYNPDTNEMKHFVTDPNKIYRVKVAPPIVHSYRNLQTTEVITGNFPTALFMGKDKKGYTPDQKIDEIRHEHVVENVQNFYILGAQGRLGKAITDKLYADMGYHKYNVIPIFEKFSNDKQGIEKIKTIMDFVIKNKTPNDVIINCIAKTNVQNQAEDFLFPNFSLPVYLTEIAVKNQIHFIQFSTDYIFKEDDELNNYTRSKKRFEAWVDTVMESPILFDFDRDDFYKYLHVIRLANLFSQDPTDIHNLLNKLYLKCKKGGNFSASENLVVMPTDVEDVADYLVKTYLPNITENYVTINISGKPYTLFELVDKFLQIDVIKTKLDPIFYIHTDKFLNDRWISLDCDLAMFKKIDIIKQNLKE